MGNSLLDVKRLAWFCLITEQEYSVETKSREAAGKACLAERNNAQGNAGKKIL